jgi:ABC-type maltose transport system permease subunit
VWRRIIDDALRRAVAWAPELATYARSVRSGCVPTAIIFLFFQRAFVPGIALSGLKE